MLCRRCGAFQDSRSRQFTTGLSLSLRYRIKATSCSGTADDPQHSNKRVLHRRCSAAKTCTTDCISKKVVKNTSEFPMVYAENNHPEIISMDVLPEGLVLCILHLLLCPQRGMLSGELGNLLSEPLATQWLRVCILFLYRRNIMNETFL